jgi:hypothetical protein
VGFDLIMSLITFIMEQRSRRPNYTPPVNTSLPEISYTSPLIEGDAISTTNGTWDNFGTISYSYKWFRNSVEVSGETQSYVPLSAFDYGFFYTCEVTATDEYGATTASWATEFEVIFNQDTLTYPEISFDSFTSTFSINVTPVFTQPGIIYYQWYLNNSPVFGETGETYVNTTLASLDEIYLEVTVINAYSSLQVYSNTVTVV